MEIRRNNGNNSYVIIMRRNNGKHLKLKLSLVQFRILVFFVSLSF